MLDRAWRRLGYRGSALAFFALLDLIYAVSLLSPPAEARQSPTMRFIADMAPLWVWALAWGSAGVLCAIQAWRQADRWAFAAAIAVKVVWGLMYVVGTFVADLERAYVGATVWLSFAAFVALIAAWPEPGKGPSEKA